jgi:hypothetical protein
MATHGTVDVWLDRVKDSAPIIRKYAAETEEKRRLSRPVVDAMLQAGLYSNTAASASRYESVGARILGVESDWGSFAL